VGRHTAVRDQQYGLFALRRSEHMAMTATPRWPLADHSTKGHP